MRTRFPEMMAFSLCFALAVPGGSLHAQEDKPASKPAPALDDELFKRLLGDGPAAEDDDSDGDPLERAIRGMRDAQQRIAGRDTGAQTRNVQERVVRDLEKLIEQAGKPPSGQPSGRPQPNPQPEPQPQDEEPSQSGEEPQTAEPQGSGREREDAEDSSEETRESEPKEVEPELERRRQMVHEVWGHLPPAVRERLLNVPSDKYLPRYDDLVRRYFEALAEEGRRE